MRPRNFALIVGGVTLAAFLVAMLLPSCGSPGDCTCENPYAQDAGPDWFDAYYSECVDMCEAAKEWGEECGWLAMREGCVEWLWYLGTDLSRCESAAECYRTLTGLGQCPGGPFEEGWNPPTWASGCPDE